MSDHDILRDWLTLLRTPGVGSARVRTWLAEAGDIKSALALARRDPRLSVAALAWLRAPDTVRLQADMDWLALSGHRLLRCDEADFPPQLETIANPPAALFVSGQAHWLLRPQLAVVGARGASQAGLANARLFAGALARSGLVVTSGLAAGIDAAAHAAALAAGGATIAVMGTGPDRIYPTRHRELATGITRAGALVSEFVPGVGPRPAHFPRRNRIIAGLTLGTLVVEAGVRSGSLITARLAAEQGREVFAVPGSIHNPLARGCHRLIRDGVQLIETVDEILEALRPLACALGVDLAARLAQHASAGTEPVPPTDAGDSHQRRVLAAMGRDEPLALDTLSQRSGLPPQVLSSVLLELELEGKVGTHAGGHWLRLG